MSEKLLFINFIEDKLYKNSEKLLVIFIIIRDIRLFLFENKMFIGNQFRKDWFLDDIRYPVFDRLSCFVEFIILKNVLKVQMNKLLGAA